MTILLAIAAALKIAAAFFLKWAMGGILGLAVKIAGVVAALWAMIASPAWSRRAAVCLCGVAALCCMVMIWTGPDSPEPGPGPPGPSPKPEPDPPGPLPNPRAEFRIAGAETCDALEVRVGPLRMRRERLPIPFIRVPLAFRGAAASLLDGLRGQDGWHKGDRLVAEEAGDVSAFVIRSGWSFADSPAADLQEAEREAREAKRGFWGQITMPEPADE